MTINAYEARFNVAKSQEKATKTEEKSLSKILKPMLKRIKKASKAGKSSIISFDYDNKSLQECLVNKFGFKVSLNKDFTVTIEW